ncbi:GyrI-like small molecule binding domain-containing protein [Cohnella sp. OV330]|uniref:GyrI-like domain-containing protein n=1 Tax=Cohnella sp. OV330 TaxID=1855288 RepID=UPI0008E2847C|nr:GyrI-like domain-containing protein [Cohnella sp. OV330]SFB51750.1 GyrI-like small molecule binding domain-containing protein [Cohnella sp. OV330]
MSSYLVDVLDRKEVRLVGFSIVESLNKMMETKVGGKLRKELERRQSEVANRAGSGMYLIQIYPQDGQWTPDVPYRHIFAYEVGAFAQIPADMVSYTLPAGRFIKVVHKGAESQIGDTYDFINQTYGVRPIDIEYWSDIHTLENEDNQIDIYVPR